MGSNSISKLKIHLAKSEVEEKRHRHNKGGEWRHYFGVFGDVALVLLATPACLCHRKLLYSEKSVGRIR